MTDATAKPKRIREKKSLFDAMADDYDHPAWCIVCVVLVLLAGLVI